MPDILFAINAYRRTLGNLPELKLINMFVEKTPTSETDVSAMSREGLFPVTTIGSGPIRAIFSQPGTFGGDVFTVSGTSVYRGATLLGTLAGTDPVSIAASSTEVVFTAGSTPKSYNGTTFSNITMPVTYGNIAAVVYVSELFVFIVKDTHRFYWSSINDARTVNALDYASSESSPDNLLDARVARGNLVLLGAASIEPWAPSANADLPFTKINQNVFDVGVFDTNCAALLDNSLYFVGSDGFVYRADEVPVKVSDFSIDERIYESEDVLAFSFGYQGHKFFCVQHDDGTHLYDVATGQWCEFQSYGLARWRVNCAAMIGRAALFGDSVDGSLWELSGWVDTGSSVQIDRLLTLYFPTTDSFAVDELSIICNPGQTEALVGSGSSPVVQFRSSRDAGETWGDWRSADLGASGKYRRKVRTRRWGTFDGPGGMFEAKCSEPVPFRVSGAKVNEADSGRSRG